MPKIALLAGANPKQVDEGPTVQLFPGLWAFNHNAKDSILDIIVKGPKPDRFILNDPTILETAPDPQLLVVQTCSVCVAVTKKGTETYLTVMAVKRDNANN